MKQNQFYPHEFVIEKSVHNTVKLGCDEHKWTQGT